VVVVGAKAVFVVVVVVVIVDVVVIVVAFDVVVVVEELAVTRRGNQPKVTCFVEGALEQLWLIFSPLITASSSPQPRRQTPRQQPQH
jgi:hypothetical protein